MVCVRADVVSAFQPAVITRVVMIRDVSICVICKILSYIDDSGHVQMMIRLVIANDTVASQGASGAGVGIGVTVGVGVGGSPTLVPGVNGSFSPGTGGGGAGVAVRFAYARSSFT